MKNFVFGFLTAAVVIFSGVWFARHEIVKSISFGFEKTDQPAVLLTNIQLRQNGKEVGKIDKGTVLLLSGRAKDSPMEYFSVSLGWETRGVESQRVYRVLPKDEAAFIEMVILH